jgi:ABC-type glycerol-3-phosphate transport system substrate-binding protein
MTFSLGMGGGGNIDSTDLHGALFKAFGATLVDGKGNITLDTDEVGHVLEFSRKLVKFYPADAVSYDDASNNRALISGTSALIFNPPSAWAVAKRDSPQVAADCWTFPVPSGLKGRFLPTLDYFWGVYQFSQDKTITRIGRGTTNNPTSRRPKLRPTSRCRFTIARSTTR